MKTIYTFALCMFAAATTFAQKSNVIFFSEQALPFYLHINGVKQNEVPQTNIKVTDLTPEVGYKALIVFQDNTIPSMNKPFYLDANQEVTLNIKKNKKGEYILQWMGAVAIGGNPTTADQYVTVYGSGTGTGGTVTTTTTTVQETTTTTTTGGGNNNTNTNGGWNSNVTVTENNSNTNANTTTYTENVNVNTNANVGVDANMNTNVNGTTNSENVNVNANVGGFGVNVNVNATVTGTGVDMNTNTNTNNGGWSDNNGNANVNVNANTNGGGWSDNNGNANVNVNANTNGGWSDGNTNTNTNTSNTNVNTTYTTTTTTTTTTTDNNSWNNTTNNNNTTTNTNYGTTGANCFVIDQTEFEKIKKSIKDKSFSDTQLTQAKQITRSKCLSSAQVAEIVKDVFGFEETRLEYAKFAYPYCSDPQNYYLVNDSFSFSSSIEDLEKAIHP